MQLTSMHRQIRPMGRPLSRLFSSTQQVRSLIDPSNPNELHLYRIKRPGTVFKEPLDPNLYLSQEPMYVGPLTSQISFTKRWSLGFSAVATYVGYLCLDLVDVSSTVAALGMIPLAAPLPVVQYFAGNYVTRIFRVYRKDQPQTFENLTTDETLMVEKLSLFGRSTFGVPIKVEDSFITNKRLGWINWVSVDEKTGALTKMYVDDDVGGIKMDRVWGILEKNSGINNGREFLNELDPTEREKL